MKAWVEAVNAVIVRSGRAIAGDCVTVNVCPAIVIVPDREFTMLPLLATAKLTVPAPTPGVPSWIEIHGTLLAAIHGQLAGAFTATLPVLPAPAIDCADCDSV